MNGLSPITWQLVQRLFPSQAQEAGTILVEQCGRNLPLLGDRSDVELERYRFAALKISQGCLELLQKAVNEAKRDWRDELVWAGFAEHIDAHRQWAQQVLRQP